MMTGLMSRPGLQHHRHLVPGLVHLAAVDAFDREHVEDDGVPVDRHRLRRDAEHGDLRAVAHVGEHVAEAGGIARHLQADVEALRHAEFLLHVRAASSRARSRRASRPSCAPVPAGTDSGP